MTLTKPIDAILCPHCEKPLSEHARPCAPKGMTRRFLFGLFAGAAAAMAIPDVWGKGELLPVGSIAVGLGDLIYQENGLPFNATGRVIGGRERRRTTNPMVTYSVRSITTLKQTLWNGYDINEPFYIVRNPKRPFFTKNQRSSD